MQVKAGHFMKVGDAADDQKTFTLSNNYSCNMTHTLTLEGAANSETDPIAESMTDRNRASKSLNLDNLAVDVKGKGTMYVVARAYNTTTAGEVRIGFQKASDNTYNVVSKAATTDLIEVKSKVEEAGTFFIYGTNVMSVQIVVWESDYSTDDETSGITKYESGVTKYEGQNIYNLSGQKVGKDYKGIVIINGKKFFAK